MNRFECGELKIVAPVDNPDEIPVLKEAGAGEIYCGYLPQRWSERFSCFDSLTRRQGMVANVPSWDQLKRILKEARKAGLPTALTLNTRYVPEMLPDVLEFTEAWESGGGDAVLVSDLGLLLALRDRFPVLKIHLSILAAIFNSRAVGFFRQFGISRAVLPRALSIDEMASISAAHPDLEFEAMVMNDKCEYIDGFCGFYHGTAYPLDTASMFDYISPGPDCRPVAYAYDLSYAGHACRLEYDSAAGKIYPENRGDCEKPCCAACFLSRLSKSGIRYLKIGGRGLPLSLKEKAVSFVREALRIWSRSTKESEAYGEIMDAYHETYGGFCEKERCYYKRSETAEG